jgi:hypothetical protein
MRVPGDIPKNGLAKAGLSSAREPQNWFVQSVLQIKSTFVLSGIQMTLSYNDRKASMFEFSCCEGQVKPDAANKTASS